MTSDNNHCAYRFALVASVDPNMARTISTTLRGLPLNVQFVAPTELAEARLDSCALIICDGEIPDDLPDFHGALVVLSPSDTIEAYDRGADLVVQRPIVPNVLAARLRSVLRRYFPLDN